MLSKKKIKAIKAEYVTVYTDASYCHYTKTAGWACWIKYGNGEVFEYATHIEEDVGSSTEAEMKAIFGAMVIVKEFIKPKPRTVILIGTDSQEAINFIQNQVNDKQSAKKTVKKEIAKLIHENRPEDTFLTMRKVRAHSNSEGARSWVNNKVDAEAKRVMKHYREWKIQNGLAEMPGRKKELKNEKEIQTNVG